jgi:hypothetical protein
MKDLQLEVKAMWGPVWVKAWAAFGRVQVAHERCGCSVVATRVGRSGRDRARPWTSRERRLSSWVFETARCGQAVSVGHR